MDNILNAVIGVSGCLLTTATAQSAVSTWVSVICSAVITIVTCGLQVYHMIKDRDKDTTEEEDEQTEDNEK